MDKSITDQRLIIKRRIKESFTKSAVRYDLHAIVQKKIASILLERVTPLLSEAGRTLDLGCGTGFISVPLLRMGIKTFGVDFSSKMIDVARKKAVEEGLKHTTFFNADSEYLPFRDRTFSLVTSSLMYQWVWGLKRGFMEVSRVLRPGGTFSFTILGKDSLKELRETYIEASERLSRDGLPPLIPFLEAKRVREAMGSSNFKEITVDTLSFSRPYSSLFQLLRSLKDIGASNPLNGRDKTFKRGTILKVMDTIYKERFSEDDKVKATYEIIFCSGRKG